MIPDSGRRRRSPAVLFLLGLGACLTSGCGYSFSGTSLPGHLKTIAIPVFQNESLDPTIADEVTKGLLDLFLEDNRLKVVRESRADCVLEGKVVHYERRVYSYTSNQEPQEYIVVIKLAVVLKDRVKNRDLWSADELQATATYAAATGSTVGQAPSEVQARELAIKQLGQDILAKSLEQW
jgi:outer membrane lipopolysaccharide assembly protein LptE/RlpB